MTNAIFRLPAPWTCTDHTRQSPCEPGTATRGDAAHISALDLTAAEAQAWRTYERAILEVRGYQGAGAHA